jgi:magnesium chelatase subunit D
VSATAVDPAAIWADAALATELFAVDPRGTGGLLLRAGPGPQRDAVCAWIRADLPAGAPLLRVPINITEDRLLGGLSLAATLAAGRVVSEQGLLAQADGGAVTVAMAERLEPGVGSHLAAALDRGEIALERDGITATLPCRIGVVALDEGIGDERAPDSLRDRLAFHVALDVLDPRAAAPEGPTQARAAEARARLSEVVVPEDIVSVLCRAAEALGVASLRAPILAAAAARAHAALAGRAVAGEEDASVAARLVLGPRATRLPAAEPEPEPEPEPESQPEPEPESQPEPEPESQPENENPPPNEEEAPPAPPDRPPSLDEIVVEAARTGIPAGLLDALALGQAPRSGPRSAGRAGAVRASTHGGRPAGTRAAAPRPGERMNVVETLRAAAPWQPIRRRELAARQVAHAHAETSRRVQVRKEDFRVTRFQQRTETSVIFAVDASGSAALQRLAEAKGAVEQVLADCYVRRDHVALLAFRGKAAALLLPPTRSLARVRKCLADLAGGGATPIASGIDAALALALESRKRGRSPVVVVMTDGRANVARDGREGGVAGTEDALASARALRGAGIRALLLDTSPRPSPRARALAVEMGATYLPLPYLDAKGISRQVQALAKVSP